MPTVCVETLKSYSCAINIWNFTRFFHFETGRKQEKTILKSFLGRMMDNALVTTHIN